MPLARCRDSFMMELATGKPAARRCRERTAMKRLLALLAIVFLLGGCVMTVEPWSPPPPRPQVDLFATWGYGWHHVWHGPTTYGPRWHRPTHR